MDLVRILIVAKEGVHKVVRVHLHSKLHGSSVDSLKASAEINEDRVHPSDPAIDP